MENKLKYTLGLLLTISLIACENEYPECILRPYTKSEQLFVDSLENLGFTVYLSRWDNIPCDYLNDGDYQIFIDDLDDDLFFHLDSLRTTSRVLTRKLYMEIIEDSIIYELPTITISYRNKNTLKNGSNRHILDIIFPKSDLEKTFGKKIIRKGKKVFRQDIIPPLFRTGFYQK